MDRDFRSNAAYELPAVFIFCIFAAVFAGDSAPYVVVICCLLMVFLLYFYRRHDHDISPTSSTIVSPSEGTVIEVKKLATNGNYYVAIFLSPLDQHYQLFPCNCIPIKQYYDATGKFEIVMNLDKSRENEKFIHWLRMDSGRIVKLTQIAGLLPRRIDAPYDIGVKKYAGDHLGMIKFGSRVDLEFPSDGADIFVTKGQKIYYGDKIASYTSHTPFFSDNTHDRRRYRTGQQI